MRTSPRFSRVLLGHVQRGNGCGCALRPAACGGPSGCPPSWPGPVLLCRPARRPGWSAACSVAQLLQSAPCMAAHQQAQSAYSHFVPERYCNGTGCGVAHQTFLGSVVGTWPLVRRSCRSEATAMSARRACNCVHCISRWHTPASMCRQAAAAERKPSTLAAVVRMESENMWA